MIVNPLMFSNGGGVGSLPSFMTKVNLTQAECDAITTPALLAEFWREKSGIVSTTQTGTALMVIADLNQLKDAPLTSCRFGFFNIKVVSGGNDYAWSELNNTNSFNALSSYSGYHPRLYPDIDYYMMMITED